MKLPPSRTASRAAFTLIELLVVITIIAVLASLLLAAIFKAFTTAQVVQTRNDISQLEAAIANFKQDFQVDYLPSSIQAGDPYYARLYPQAGSSWGPSLQGNLALVYFLSGPQGQGFSSNPSSPTFPPFPGEIRKGPYFNFPSNRMNAQGMFCDVFTQGNSKFGNPFAYFSAYSQNGAPNGYNPGDNINIGCPGPYHQLGGPPINWIKPDTCQIISAGPYLPGYATQFGPGGPWPGVSGPPGFNDISNFATGQLGAGQ